MQQFHRDFMERTNTLLHTYQGNNDATMLLNCMIGLLIVPNERLLSQLPDEPLLYSERWGIQLEYILSIDRNQADDRSTCSLLWFVRKLRNAVAHFNILPIHENSKVTGFELWDKKGFRAYLPLQAIRHFCQQILQQLC